MRTYNLMGEGGSKILKDSTTLTYTAPAKQPAIGIIAMATTTISAVDSNIEGLQGEVLDKGDAYFGKIKSITIAAGGKLQVIKHVL